MNNHKDTMPNVGNAHRLSGLYPSSSGIFPHTLSQHPLLTLDALAEAAAKMERDHVECRRADPSGFNQVALASSNPAEIVRNIEQANCWVMLRFTEQLPAYRQLLADTLSQLSSMIVPQTGPMRDLRAFIFISSSGIITPFHFDPEYNILFQVAGRKTFATCPAEPPFLPDAAHNRLHHGGDNMLAWDALFTSGARAHALGPGDALFVPYKSPHHVQVDDGPSISISMTWKSDWSLAHDDAWRFNAALRKVGLKPPPIPPWPARTPVRSVGSKLLRRSGVRL